MSPAPASKRTLIRATLRRSPLSTATPSTDPTKPTPMSRRDGGTLLAFGAHPDDIEFGCGAVIALETRLGRPAHFVVCSKGESGTNGTPAERTTESEKSASLLGATVEFL